MSEITMTYNDVDTSTLLKVLSVKRNIGNSRSVSKRNNRLIGSVLESVYIENKIIEVNFSIASRSISTNFVSLTTPNIVVSSNTNNLKREIAKLFNQTEPKKLKFSDENIYYMAIQTEEIEIEDITEWYALGTVKFVILDGVSHALNDRVFTSSNNRLVIQNNGGLSVYPKLSFTSSSNLKMISFVLGNDVFQIGKNTGDIIINAGQKVEIDMSDGSIIVAGNKRLYRNFNSRRLKIDLGTQTIGIAVNSGATIPVVRAVINEVYL